MSKVDLKNYICVVPFTNVEVHTDRRFLCCPSWLNTPLPKRDTLKDEWNSVEANEIRKSVVDGTYKFCDKTQCPFLQQLINNGDVGNTNVFVNKNRISDNFKSILNKFENNIEFEPTTINFSFDRSCNLKCPSCRIDLIVENSDGIKRVKKTINEIENQYGNSVKTIYITGTGDPFVSVGFRDFLRNFDDTKWTKLKSIHLHTNATKWDKKMWESMPKIHKYVKTCEISIDAATKETYENKVRLGGNWDDLIENLNFISTIPSLKNIKTSFVVQTYNYKEMKKFHDLMFSIFGKKVNVFYGRINNWGSFTDQEFLKHKIWDESHPEYSEFVKTINTFLPLDSCWNNLQEFVKQKRYVI